VICSPTRRLDRRIATTTEDLAEAVAASGTTLTTLLGIGDLMAAKILARTGSRATGSFSDNSTTESAPEPIMR
jgi:hypothetical protein